MGPLCLAMVAGLGPATSTAAPSEVSVERLPVVLAGDMASDAALREELELRLPDHVIVVPSSPADIPSAFLWVGAVRGEDGLVALHVIVSDGRLYQRPLVLPAAGDRARVAAGAIANLVDGIERKSVAPTRTEVEVPPLGLEQEGPPDPEPETVAGPGTSAEDPPPATVELPTPIQGGLQLSAAGVFVAGLGPPTAFTGPVGAGGVLGVAWVRSGGLLLGGALRGMGWRAKGLGVGRVRLTAQVGYAWTRESWSIVVAGGPSIEPLWLGASIREPGGARAVAAPLFGATLSAGPRWRAWSQPGRPSVWLGADLDVSGSAEARRAAGVVFVQDAGTGEGLIRAGGLELGVAAVLEVRIPRSR